MEKHTLIYVPMIGSSGGIRIPKWRVQDSQMEGSDKTVKITNLGEGYK